MAFAAGGSVGAAAAPVSDLLGSDDLLGGLGELSVSAPAAPSAPEPPSLRLQPSPALAPADFQRKWGGLQAVQQFTHQLSPSALSLIQPTGQQVCESHLQGACALFYYCRLVSQSGARWRKMMHLEETFERHAGCIGFI